MCADTCTNNERDARLRRALDSVVKPGDRERHGIGMQKEKTLHAVLKAYEDPDVDHHEIPIGNYIADIYREDTGSITEIQTGSFSPLREKLKAFLPLYHVTVVCISDESGELARSVIIEDDSGEKREKISAADEQTDGNEKESNDRADRPKDRNGTDEVSDPDPESVSENEQGRAKTGDETEYALALAMMMASLVLISIFSSRKGGRLL